MINIKIIEQIKTTKGGLVGQLLGRQKEIDILIGQSHQQKGGHIDILDLGQEKDIGLGSLGQNHQTEPYTKETEREILGQGQKKDKGQGQKKQIDTGNVQGQSPGIGPIKILVQVIIH